MNALFDISKINDLKKEEIICICKNCTNRFLADKRNVKRFLGLIKESNGKNKIEYCSNKCQREYESKKSKIQCFCTNCNLILLKNKSQLKKSKSGNLFCSRSCSAEFNNKNKKSGTRRSKLEMWIEEKLKSKYNFEIVFNDKSTINSELDIYIPSLRLAFELNGIFHYEAIYGDEKLNKIKNNDNTKFQSCIKNNIELCVIDTSSSKNFKPDRDIKYLNIIEEIINKRIVE